MDKCIYCGKETALYYAERPVCIKCAESRTEREPADPPKPTAGARAERK